VKSTITLVTVLLAFTALSPMPASALCQVEGRLEAIRMSLDDRIAFVVHIRAPRAVVTNFFHVERTANGSLGDVPALLELLSLANPAHATVQAVGDLASCPDAAEMERARVENRGVPSGRLISVFVKYR
jgi:hypothetical protein